MVFFCILGLAVMIILVTILLLMHCFCKKYLRKVPIISTVLVKNDVNIEPSTALPSFINIPLGNLEKNQFQKSKIDQSLNEQNPKKEAATITAKTEKPMKEEKYTTDPKIDLKTGDEKVLVNSMWVSK